MAKSPGGIDLPGWADGTNHFLGVDVSSGADHHYGWVETSLSNSGVPSSGQPWYDITICDWAYNTQANQAIAIPEPSSAGVFGVLAVWGFARRGI